MSTMPSLLRFQIAPVGQVGRHGRLGAVVAGDVDLVGVNIREAFAQRYATKPLVFDVRKKSENDSEHVEGAINVPLNRINNHLAEFPKDRPFILHCAGGYRSMIAASILKARGWDDFVDVESGISGIKKTAVQVTACARRRCCDHCSL